MAIYDLLCPKCEHRFDVMGKHNQEFDCENCGNKLTIKDQIHHAVMFDLRGPGGWYSEGKSIPGCNATPKEPSMEYLTGEKDSDK